MNLLEAVKEVILQMEEDIGPGGGQRGGCICSECERPVKHHIRLLKMMVKLADVPVASASHTVLKGSTDAVLMAQPSFQPKPNTALYGGVDPWDEAKQQSSIGDTRKAGDR